MKIRVKNMSREALPHTDPQPQLLLSLSSASYANMDFDIIYRIFYSLLSNYELYGSSPIKMGFIKSADFITSYTVI